MLSEEHKLKLNDDLTFKLHQEFRMNDFNVYKSSIDSTIVLYSGDNLICVPYHSWEDFCVSQHDYSLTNEFEAPSTESEYPNGRHVLSQWEIFHTEYKIEILLPMLINQLKQEKLFEALKFDYSRADLIYINSVIERNHTGTNGHFYEYYFPMILAYFTIMLNQALNMDYLITKKVDSDNPEIVVYDFTLVKGERQIHLPSELLEYIDGTSYDGISLVDIYDALKFINK